MISGYHIMGAIPIPILQKCYPLAFHLILSLKRRLVVFVNFYVPMDRKQKNSLFFTPSSKKVQDLRFSL